MKINKIVIGMALVSLCVSCSHFMEKERVRVVNVGVQTVQGTSVGTTREYVGTVEESSSVDLSFESGGRVTKVYVREGQRVAAGALIAEIEDVSARNAYEAARATLDQAQDAYDRAKLVHDQGSLPEVRWVEVQTKLNQAQSLADISKRNLDNCQLRAPVSGTVCDKNIEVGTSVAPYLPVVRLLNLSGMNVKVSVPETDINTVRTGDEATVAVGALGNKEYTGVVGERNVSADPLSHSYTVRLRLRGDTRELLPGMVCRVRMADEAKDACYELPNRAVQLDEEGRHFVWLVEDSTAVRRYVSVGDLTSTGVVVSDGLTAGDVVIVDGTLKVSGGTRVRIKE